MNKKIVLLDLIVYAAIPYVIWNYGKEPLGEYLAMLLSTAPGFIYTIYRFFKEKSFNIAGVFIIVSLFIGTLVDLLSGSADKMLWNQIYLSYGFALVYLLSVIIKKPLLLYFAVDWNYLQGNPRKTSKILFYKRGNFAAFQLFTCWIFFGLIVKNTWKLSLLLQYGVQGYDKMIIYMNIAGWVFSILNMVGMVLVYIKINKYIKENGQASFVDTQVG